MERILPRTRLHAFPYLYAARTNKPVHICIYRCKFAIECVRSYINGPSPPNRTQNAHVLKRKNPNAFDQKHTTTSNSPHNNFKLAPVDANTTPAEIVSTSCLHDATRHPAPRLEAATKQHAKTLQIPTVSYPRTCKGVRQSMPNACKQTGSHTARLITSVWWWW